MRDWMRRTVFAAVMMPFLLAACDRSSSDTPAMPTPTMNAFAGTWRSSAVTAVNGACTSMNWTITPTGTASATIAYSATCSGVAVTGTGNGTLSGNTLNWTTSGTAANNCSFGLNGTAIPDSGADLRVTYSGTVCGLPVSGSDTLHR
jgi:hypothetical protein